MKNSYVKKILKHYNFKTFKISLLKLKHLYNY